MIHQIVLRASQGNFDTAHFEGFLDEILINFVPSLTDPGQVCAHVGEPHIATLCEWQVISRSPFIM